MNARLLSLPLDVEALSRQPVPLRIAAEILGVSPATLKGRRWRQKYGLIEAPSPPSCRDDRCRFLTAASVDEALRRMAAHRALFTTPA